MLKIQNLNTAQRGGLFLTVAACLLLILAHSPTSGYVIYLPHEVEILDDNPAFPTKEYRYYGNSSGACYDGFRLSRKSYTYDNTLPGELQDQWARSAEVDRQRGKEMLSEHNCFGRWVAPFSEWKTTAPITPWIGNVVNLLSTILTTLILGAVWLFVFRKANPGSVSGQ